MCEYCKPSTEFIPLNTTSDYSDLEIAMCGNMLRVRHMKPVGVDFVVSNMTFDTQDIINLKYCPMCGRELK